LLRSRTCKGSFASHPDRRSRDNSDRDDRIFAGQAGGGDQADRYHRQMGVEPVITSPDTVHIEASAERGHRCNTGEERAKEDGRCAQTAGRSGPAPPSEETAQRALDGLSINGCVNNAATSQFSLGPRFGNTASRRSLYNFSLNVRLNNSALDAKSYSLDGFVQCCMPPFGYW
jgi:hypothetical protein